MCTAVQRLRGGLDSESEEGRSVEKKHRMTIFNYNIIKIMTELTTGKDERSTDERYARLDLSTELHPFLKYSKISFGYWHWQTRLTRVRAVDFVDWTLIYGLPDVRIRGFSKFPTLETGIGA